RAAAARRMPSGGADDRLAREGAATDSAGRADGGPIARSPSSRGRAAFDAVGGSAWTCAAMQAVAQLGDAVKEKRITSGRRLSHPPGHGSSRSATPVSLA